MSDDVATAEKIVANLKAKREKLVAQMDALDKERTEISYAAHAANDKAAMRRLEQIADASVRQVSELESVDAAIRVAQEKVEIARQVEASQLDKEKASELRAVLKTFVDAGLELDEALLGVSEAGQDLMEAATQMRALGQNFATAQQVGVLGLQAIQTALQRTPWAKEFRPLAPRDHKSFRELVLGWASHIEPAIAARLGETAVEQTTKETADADAA